jgi:hypothetical protein
MKYRVTVEVRKEGAIGVFYDKVFTVESDLGSKHARMMALDTARAAGFATRFVKDHTVEGEM